MSNKQLQVQVDHKELAESLGMDELTYALCLERVSRGTSYVELAEKHGLSRNSISSRLMSAPAREMTQHLMRIKMVAESAEALQVLRSLMRSARSEKVRLDSALGLLDRAGFTPQSATQGSLNVSGKNVQVNITI